MEATMSNELKVRVQCADVFACSGEQLETLIKFAEDNSEAVATAWLKGVQAARSAFSIGMLEFISPQ